MGSKHTTLNGGGITILCHPDMEYMAKPAYDEIKRHVKQKLVEFQVLDIKDFSMSERLPRIPNNVRNREVFYFPSFNENVNDGLVMHAQVTEALHHSKAKRVTSVIPFIPYLRQDRKDQSRVPISARMAIKILEIVDDLRGGYITLDPHTDQALMNFKNPCDHLPGHVIFVPWVQKQFGDRLEDVVIVGPDAGSEKRVMKIASLLDCERSFFTKSRAGRGDSQIGVLHGADVTDKICILNDDIIDTGGTIIQAAQALKREGAAEVIISATHAVFGTKNGITAYQKLADAGFRVVVTNSLMTEYRPWLDVIPLSKFMAHAIIQNVIPNGSVSRIITNGLPD